MSLVSMAMLLVGLVLLVVGAEFLVRGASRLAAAVGISPLVIGLTVVAYGTSTPELAVSLSAGLSGSNEIAVANVVGSNIFNVLFILGACALIQPLVVSQQLVRLDVPIMIGISLLTLVLAWDGALGLVDGLILASGIVIYTAWAIQKSRRETAAVKAEYAQELGPEKLRPTTKLGMAAQIGFVLAGLGTLVLGSHWFVEGSIALAKLLGVSDTVIGLTIVAAGTSLPEVATSIVATIRGERDIAIGNVIGSNIYNILAILGIAAIATPGGLVVPPTMLRFDLVIMLAVAIACLPIFFTGYRIARWEGGVFLGCYVAYVAYLILSATGNTALPAYSDAMLLFVLPLVGLTVIVCAVRALRNNHIPA